MSAEATQRRMLADAEIHSIRSMCTHPIRDNDHIVYEMAEPAHYQIRVRGRLGATLLSAFPTLHAEARAGETVLTGDLRDEAALHGVLAQIEALGLVLLELHRDQRLPDAHSKHSVDSSEQNVDSADK